MFRHWATCLFWLGIIHTGAVRGQFAGCDYTQNLQVGVTYTITSQNYPTYYSAYTSCRWQAIAPTGYTVLLECQDIDLPVSTNCVNDKLQISKSGSVNLADGVNYCGYGTLSAASNGTRMTIALLAPSNTLGGRFKCTVKTQAATTCRCGVRKTSKIVGGVETLVNEFPMMAGLVNLNDKKVYCGATIIAVLYAVTAAHCVSNKQAAGIALLVGDHNLNTGTDTPYASLYLVAQYLIHGGFNSNTMANDIALVKTTQTINYNAGVGPACLPFKYATSNLAGTRVEAVGWGTTDFGGPTSSVLMKTFLDIITVQLCQSKLPNISNSQICTYTTNKDACQNDSGGPLFLTDSGNGLVYNIGIISYGIGCASSNPGVSINVAQYLNWITANTPDVGYCVT